MSTAAILIIGNEILSGKTQDSNVAWLGQRLSALGIKLCEVRVVRDEEPAVVAAVRALSAAYTYVFSTGGIGPTHDDITAECMAAAFNTTLEINVAAREILVAYYKSRDIPMSDATLRMARIPVGAALLHNPVSSAPGFKIGNVFVMAGVPRIMQGMFESFEATLERGLPVLSRSVTGRMRESEIAAELTDIQNRWPDIEIGSYPAMKDGQFEVSVVLRGQDEKRLDAAAAEVEMLAAKWRRG